MPLLARASAYTESMSLGTSVLLLPLLNPMDVVEQATTIDVMSRGNFILGVGLGYRENEILASGMKRNELIDRFCESINVIKVVWENETANFSGKHFSIKDAKINPRPFQKPRPPILVGAYDDRAVIRAGSIGDGWIVPPELASTPLERKLTLYQNEMRLRKRRGILAMMRAFHVTSNREEANSVRNLVSSHFASKRKMGLDRLSDLNDNLDYEVIVGEPSHCIEAMSKLKNRYQPDHLILLMGFQGISNEQLVESIKLAGDSVLPCLED